MLKKAFTDAIAKYKRHGLNKQALRAAHGGNFPKAFEFINAGADPNFSMPYDLILPIDNLTIMGNVGRAAVMRNNTVALKDLLDAGLDKNLKLGRKQQSLLYLAIEARAEDAAMMLLSKGADPGSYDGGPHSSAYSLAREYRLGRVVQALDNLQGVAAAPTAATVDAPVIAAVAAPPVQITGDDLKLKGPLIAPDRAQFLKKNKP